jgi:hypothetical protein
LTWVEEEEAEVAETERVRAARRRWLWPVSRSDEAVPRVGMRVVNSGAGARKLLPPFA